jgi:hypothetical protein
MNGTNQPIPNQINGSKMNATTAGTQMPQMRMQPRMRLSPMPNPSSPTAVVPPRPIPFGRERSPVPPQAGMPPRYLGTNNVYYKQGCPALMDDARFVTYYNSTNELTNQMQKLNGIRSSNQFRTFMQDHGLDIMNSERSYYLNKYACAPKVACSQGYYDLWMRDGGDWGNMNQ